jgi:hypothetical protein
MHVGGKIWHPYNGYVTPPNGTPVVTHEGEHAATHFYPVDANGEVPNINGAALAGGSWKKVYAVINAQASQERTITTTVGMEKSSEKKFGVTVSAEVGATIKAIFSATVTTSTTFESTSSETWSQEHTISDTFRVEKGDSVVVWQYVYNAQYAGQTVNFRSDIFYHTNSLSEVPQEQFQ